MKIRKWTFIFVHFSKIQNRFEKTLHHSFFSVRLPHFAAPYLYALILFIWYIRTHTIMLRIVYSRKIRKRWSKSWGCSFGEFLVGHFRGMFWKNVWGDLFAFSKRWSKSWGCSFGKFLVGHFRGMFWIIYFGIFGEMEQNILSQTDGPKVGKVVFGNSWLAIFGGCFE